MTDADLVYNACLRAERTLEAITKDGNHPVAAELALPSLIAIKTLREEIGNGLAREGR